MMMQEIFMNSCVKMIQKNNSKKITDFNFRQIYFTQLQIFIYEKFTF